MALVGVDWGTSSLRGALMDNDGHVLEERSAPNGILAVPPGGFPDAFNDLFGDWMRAAGTRCLISGMAGSQQGWVEAPYCACPAGLADIAQKVIDIEPGRIAVVPGLSDEHDGVPGAKDAMRVPDVMRGEEVQIFGAVKRTGIGDGLFVLPGTHNKWVRVEAGRVLGFRTFMTGEFYALLARHSILARTVDATAPLDEGAFLQGVRIASNGEGLLHNAFGVRAIALFGRLSPAESASYLSGLLIGEELGRQELPESGEVIVIGASALVERYALALGARGAIVRRFGAEATWAGLSSFRNIERGKR